MEKKSNFKFIMDFKDILIVFLLSFLFSLITLLIIGKPWPGSPDATIYANMAKGIIPNAPFKYRIILPFFVGFFPENVHNFIFASITILSLSGTATILYGFICLKINNDKVGNKSAALIISMIFLSSNICIYHFYNYGLVDPLFFLFLMLNFYLFEKESEFGTITCLLFTFFIKETIIFYIPILIIRSMKKKSKIMLIGLCIELIIMVLITFVLRSTSDYLISYFDRALAMIDYNVDIHQSKFNIFIQIVFLLVNYLLFDYGIILFLFLYSLYKSDLQNQISFLFLSLVVLFTLTIVTDWYRMLYLLFPLIYTIVSLPISDLMNNRMGKIITYIFMFIWISLNFIRYPLRDKFAILKYSNVIIFLIGFFFFLIYFVKMNKRENIYVTS